MNIFINIFSIVWVIVFIFIAVNAVRIIFLASRQVKNHLHEVNNLSNSPKTNPKQPIQECRYCRAVIRDQQATHCSTCGAQLPYQPS